MTSAWSNEETFKFIELYQNEPAIWNPKNEYHKDRNKVNDAWSRISEAMDVPVVELKKKKETLMTAFRLNHKKKIASLKSCSGEDVYKPIWIYYEALAAFMSDIYNCKTVLGTEDEFFDHTYNSQSTQPGSSINNSRNMTIPRSIPTRLNKMRKSDGKHVNNTDNFHAKRGIEESVTYFKNDNDVKNADMDEYDLYGQLLAKKLRKLNERQRDVAMHEIDNIMFRAKIDSSSQHRSYSSSSSPVHSKLKSPVFIVTQQNNEGQFEDENITYHEHMQPQPPS